MWYCISCAKNIKDFQLEEGNCPHCVAPVVKANRVLIIGWSHEMCFVYWKPPHYRVHMPGRGSESVHQEPGPAIEEALKYALPDGWPNVEDMELKVTVEVKS